MFAFSLLSVNIIIVGQWNSFRPSHSLIEQENDNVTVEQMLQSSDVTRLLQGAPRNSVRQTIDVERLEDEILSEQPATVSGGRASSTKVDGALDIDYDKVSEQASMRRFLLSCPI